MKRKLLIKLEKQKVIKKNKKYTVESLKKKKKIKLIFFSILVSFLIWIIYKRTFIKNFWKMLNLKNYINIAYAFDANNYHYIAHVSMKSIMLSQKKNTYIIFHMLVPPSIKKEEKEVIDKVCQQHKNCEIKYFEMDERYKGLNTIGALKWSTAIYYRLRLPDLLTNEKKILYLDCDTLIYKDLTELYNYNINGKYFTGMLEPRNEIKNYINTGVMLFNLEELRQGNIIKKIEEYLFKHNFKLTLPVNDSLNRVCHEKNGYFPPEFIQWGFCSVQSIDKYYKDLKIKFDKERIIKAYKDPYIYHLIGYKYKPWKGITSDSGKVCIDPFIRFYEMAKKTDYYYDIINTFTIRTSSK